MHTIINKAKQALVSEALKDIYAPISKQFHQVDDILTAKLNQEYHPKIAEINHYLINTPGKRLRPALALMMFYILCPTPTKAQEKAIQRIAAAIELIHMASLVHDDIIDQAPVRHNQPSIYQKWGAEAAIPVGVYLYAVSLDLITQAGNLNVLHTISHTVKKLCQGELNQILNRGNLTLNKARYLAILKNKTGVLFSAACKSGGLIAGASKEHLRHCKQFGTSLGILFQILDDIMDITGNEKELKKEPGQDFECGEITLPQILLLEKSPASDREHYLSLMQQQDKQGMLKIREILTSRKDVMSESYDLAKYYFNQASSSLDHFGQSQYTKSLNKLLDYIQKRSKI